MAFAYPFLARALARLPRKKRISVFRAARFTAHIAKGEPQ
jgi:hypothetical protein